MCKQDLCAMCGESREGSLLSDMPCSMATDLCDDCWMQVHPEVQPHEIYAWAQKKRKGPSMREIWEEMSRAHGRS